MLLTIICYLTKIMLYRSDDNNIDMISHRIVLGVLITIHIGTDDYRKRCVMNSCQSYTVQIVALQSHYQLVLQKEQSFPDAVLVARNTSIFQVLEHSLHQVKNILL